MRRAKKTIRGWKQAKVLLERWRRALVSIYTLDIHRLYPGYLVWGR